MFTHCAQLALFGGLSRIRLLRQAVIWLACSLAVWGSASQAQVSVSGPLQIKLGAAGQFSATVNGALSSAVVWSVNNVVNGSASTGTISASGLYTPALTIFAGHSVTITATTVGSAATSASVSVKIVNPLPVLSSATVTATAPGGAYLLDVHGSSFFPASQLVVAGSNVPTTYLSSSELESNITLPTGTVTFKAGVLNPNAGQSSPVSLTLTPPPPLLATIAQATRLLDQATFGPTLSAVQQVQQIGLAGFLNQQFATPPTLMPAIGTPPVALCPDATFRCAQHYFWLNALTANDQLR